MTTTKRDIFTKAAEETGVPRKDAAKIVQIILDNIADELVAGGTVEFRNFGVFETVEWKSRPGRNPHEPEKQITIPARTVVRFQTGRELKARMEKLDPSNF
jgi:nucleoid DNA-binding protein